jgi:uncharacterized membrane protein
MSHQYPGNPADPNRGNQNPPGYPPPPPNYGNPPQQPNYGSPPPPPGYGPPQGGGYNPSGPGGPGGPPPGYNPPGAPPSPQHGYNPQSAPPPPPAGYPPQPGYGGAPGGPGTPPFSVGDAVTWAWNKFTQNAVTMIVPALVYVVAVGIFAVMASVLPAVFGDTSHSSYTDAYGNSYGAATVAYSPASYAVMLIGYILLFAASIFMVVGMLSGCLDIADGKPVTFGSFFKPRNIGAVIVTALLVFVGVSIGTVACIIPGIIFGFLAQFAIMFTIDRSLSAVDAIKASIATVRANIGPALLAWLVQYAIMLVGEVLCGVGLIAALPVALLVQVYTYRKLSGGQVVPLEQAGYQSGPPQGIPPGSYPA